MIKKITNKDEDFYNYLGKIFGSRLVQVKTKDRFYDDDNKVWYLYIKDKKDMHVSAIVAVCDRIIKNIYATDSSALISLLNEIKKDVSLYPSTVPICYEDEYKQTGFKITKLGTYKNFVLIRNEK